MKALAVIDIDGTITDFRKLDGQIIFELYGTNKVVMLLDKMLWKINALDLITNRFIIFKARILLYSLFARKKYRECMALYKSEYTRQVKEYFNSFMNEEYNYLNDRGVDVIFLTCDPFDSFCGEDVIVIQNKFKYLQYNVVEKYDSIYIIGNNYMDDIKSGLKLRRLSEVPSNIKIYYVGNSSLISRLKKSRDIMVCRTVKEAIQMIC